MSTRITPAGGDVVLVINAGFRAARVDGPARPLRGLAA